MPLAAAIPIVDVSAHNVKLFQLVRLVGVASPCRARRSQPNAEPERRIAHRIRQSRCCRPDCPESMPRAGKAANELSGRRSRSAEGTGLEPATPCGAPHFQSVEPVTSPTSEMRNEQRTSVDQAGAHKQSGDARVTVQASSGGQNCPRASSASDPALERLISAWPTFSPAKQAAILALVDAPIG